MVYIFVSDIPRTNTYYSRPPNTTLRLPPRPPPPNIYCSWFSSPEYVFSWLYILYLYVTPFTAVFQYRRFFASPENGGIWGGGVDWVDCKNNYDPVDPKAGL